METVYLETTFISYLVARPARNLVTAAHQQVTRDWWQHRRRDFNCVISQVVIDEISAGDESEARKRLEIAASLDALPVSATVESLIKSIINAGILPEAAVRDAAHIAVATIYGVEYLLTWNCKHLANAQIAKRVARICDDLGFTMPVVCTPEELFEDLGDV